MCPETGEDPKESGPSHRTADDTRDTSDRGGTRPGYEWWPHHRMHRPPPLWGMHPTNRRRWCDAGFSPRQGESSPADQTARGQWRPRSYIGARRSWSRRYGPRPFGPFRYTSRRQHPGGIFVRLVVVVGVFITLIAGAMALFAGLIRAIFSPAALVSRPILIIGAASMLLFGLIRAAIYVGRQVFRTLATPMADLIAAAEAVTAGDLTARVPETDTGRFSTVAQTFNAMVASLERSDQQRRNLTADVAHELRTPLQIIQGNLEGVLDGVYEPDEAHINATLDATRQLARLVDDLRTLSLAEADQLPLSEEVVDVVELLADTQTSFSGQATAAGISLVTNTENATCSDTAVAIRGDPGRLDQVLANLVTNALRHTSRGGTVRLEAKALPDSVVIRVVDTGTGIAAEDLPFIFDRFWRADHARRRLEGSGSGLGLAITRQLVRLHDATIDVQSTIGKGTTFTMTFPRCDV